MLDDHQVPVAFDAIAHKKHSAVSGRHDDAAFGAADVKPLPFFA